MVIQRNISVEISDFLRTNIYRYVSFHLSVYLEPCQKLTSTFSFLLCEFNLENDCVFDVTFS